MHANEESRMLGHKFVGGAQIFLGLVGVSEGIASEALRAQGITLKVARAEVEKIIGIAHELNGSATIEIPFTSNAMRILEWSLENAKKLGHNHIGTAHLALAIVRECKREMLCVLDALGADPARIEAEVIRLLSQDG